jgi:hypothetical protein
VSFSTFFAAVSLRSVEQVIVVTFKDKTRRINPSTANYMLVTAARTAFRRPIEASKHGKHVIGGRISTTLSYPFGGGGEAGAESPINSFLHLFQSTIVVNTYSTRSNHSCSSFSSGGLGNRVEEDYMFRW